MRRMKRWSALATLLLLVVFVGFPAAARADYPVEDQQAIQKLIAEIAKWVEYIQLFQEYKDSFDENMKTLKHLEDYVHVFEPYWKLKAVKDRDVFGRVKPLVNAMNEGDEGQVENGWARLTVKMAMPDGTPMGAEEEAFETSAAQVGVADALANDAARSIGRFREESKLIEDNIRRLNTELSNDDDRALKQVLQQTLAANTIIVQQLRHTNRLMAAVVELSVMERALSRDGQTTYVNEASALPDLYNRYQGLWANTDPRVLEKKPTPP